MTQAERDRLGALKKAQKKLITQKQAAEEIGITERQVRRLLRKLRRKGDQAVIHELRGRESNRKLSSELEQRALTILSDPVYRGFGPSLPLLALAPFVLDAIDHQVVQRLSNGRESAVQEFLGIQEDIVQPARLNQNLRDGTAGQFRFALQVSEEIRNELGPPRVGSRALGLHNRIDATCRKVKLSPRDGEPRCGYFLGFPEFLHGYPNQTLRLVAHGVAGSVLDAIPDFEKIRI